jgi:chemotaxis protein MotB
VADEAPPPGAPLWIVSFADMISNMVTFFILLAAFSTPSANDATSASTGPGLREKGIFEQSSKSRALVGRRPTADAKHGSAGPENPSRRSERERDEKLDRFVQDADYSVKPDLERLPDGLRLNFAADRMFAPGAHEPRPEVAQLMEETGRFFRGEGCEFLVEAHCDGRSHETSGFASPRELSRDMAIAAAQVLIARAGVPAYRVAIVPFGASQPVASDEDAVGRAKNRRVAIVVRKTS